MQYLSNWLRAVLPKPRRESKRRRQTRSRVDVASALAFGLALGIAVSSLVVPLPAQGGDIPPATPNIETIPSGSLVIPMDNDKQNIGVPFNLKAYGLVQRLLKSNIPVKWIIRAGKGKDAVDFSATAERVLPSAQAVAQVEFRGGPFVVEAQFASQAMAVASSFGNNVAVYRLVEAAQADVRYTLAQRAFVFVANDDNNATIHTDVLNAAGFVAGEDYAVLQRPTTAAQLNGNLCATIVTEPHYDGSRDANYDTVVAAVRDFLLSGGNVLAQCKAIESYENHSTFGHFQTTGGVVKPSDPGTGFEYLAPDLPFSQFIGDLADRGGAIPRYALATGSSFTNGGHPHVQHASTTPPKFKASLSKLGSGVGSLVFYLAGHDYPGSTIEEINGRRMYLNAVFHPARRPRQCGFEIPTSTPTRTATPTPTNTAVPTSSQLATPTATNPGGFNPTATSTGTLNSFTATPTPTPASATATRTPSNSGSPTASPTIGLCGNGDLDPGETCDDGNNVSGDCCSADCRLEPVGAPCDDGLACTSGDQCDGFGVCRSEPSTGQYAILRWSPGDPLGSFTTVLGRRSLVGGHVCTDVTKMGGRARVLGDLVGLMTSGNALVFGKLTQVAGTVVTAGGAIVNPQNALIGEFRGADSSGGAPELSDCALARSKTQSARTQLAQLPADPQTTFGAVKVKLRKSLRVPASGTFGAGTAVVDFDDLKIGSSGTLELVGGPTTEDVVIRVKNRLRLGRRAKVLLNGLNPNQVVFLVDGQTNVGGSAYLPATLIGGDRIAVRRRAAVEGGLFGKTVIVAGSARVQRAGWVGWCR